MTDKKIKDEMIKKELKKIKEIMFKNKLKKERANKLKKEMEKKPKKKLEYLVIKQDWQCDDDGWQIEHWYSLHLTPENLEEFMEDYKDMDTIRTGDPYLAYVGTKKYTEVKKSKNGVWYEK